MRFQSCKFTGGGVLGEEEAVLFRSGVDTFAGCKRHSARPFLRCRQFRGSSDNSNEEVGFGDSSFADDFETRRSQTSVVVMLKCGAVAWRSVKQQVGALSTCKSESYAQSAGLFSSLEGQTDSIRGGSIRAFGQAHESFALARCVLIPSP